MKGRKESLRRDSLEASYGHLLEIPFQTALQKVKGYVVELIGYGQEITIERILLNS